MGLHARMQRQSRRDGSVPVRGGRRRGQAAAGLIDAESPRQVRDQLRGDGLFPTAIDAAGGGGGRDARERLRLPPAQVALATRQLATLARSGMPLDQALGAVGEQADDARAGQLFAALRAEVAAGEPLAGALGRWPRTFDDLYRGLVGVGAETGRLGGGARAARRLPRGARGAEAEVHAGADLSGARHRSSRSP